ncbi:molybdopterin biosynthesis protein MoeB [Neokomagataea thailandica NBRC 106555]|uniref:HesA/MoeB/ThiF family protein n=2 Tax=Neokomagataea TaxID=1223423 RepID=A0A4Y6V619_9PROT|nr:MULTISPECIES: HesA/MoeB/ThiF family protein [Neokomagataea]QDH25582.1 HesA/MoeB/ThiF family protein [Neokomagataea tanensis]GBR52630.1 molybdopterin biosynthesis protein MoeB [Neokomagataea thailandica NBRC 106555]
MMLNFTDAELERYSRHILVPEIGAKGQALCRDAAVLIIGAGGLGAPLAQQLAASGIGKIGVVDNDRIELSNLQRQTLYDTASIGLPKVEVTQKKLSALNPHVAVEVYEQRADKELLDNLLPKYDLVCDGTDNFTTRFVVSDACVNHSKTLVAGAVQKLGGQLATFRPQKGGPCYRCLFPDADVNEAMNCSQAGVLGPATSVIASLMAVEVLREIMLLNPARPSVSVVTSWEALTNKFRQFQLTRDPACTCHIPVKTNHE